jgi:hypothetical protein
LRHFFLPRREPEAAAAWGRYLEASADDPAAAADRAVARSRLRSLQEAATAKPGDQ